MALNIDGTTGISGVDGSASAPALQGTDSNTGINFGTDTVNINTGGATRATVDSSGNLNIPNDSGKIQLGTSSDLQIYHDGSNSYIDGVTSSTGFVIIKSKQIQLQNDNGEKMILADGHGTVELYNDNSKRLDTSSDGVTVHSGFQGTGSPGVIHAKTGGGANNQVFVGCSFNLNTFAGGLRRNGTSTGVELFNASDRRIKKNISPMPSILSKLNQIELKTYNYKNDDTASGLGPIAQDLISIFPEKVVKTDDGTGDDLPTNVEPWTIGTDFTWHLIKAVQELSAKVETLETKVAALEAG